MTQDRVEQAGLLWMMVKESAGPMVFVGADRRLLDLTKAAAELIGISSVKDAPPCDELLQPVIQLCQGGMCCSESSALPASRWSPWLLKRADGKMLAVWVRSDAVHVGDELVGWVLRFSDLTEPVGLRRRKQDWENGAHLGESWERFLTLGGGAGGFGAFIGAVREATGASFAGWYRDDGQHAEWIAISGDLPRGIGVRQILDELSALCRRDRPTVPFEWDAVGKNGRSVAIYVFPVGGDHVTYLVTGGLPEGITPPVAVTMTVAARVADMLMALERYRQTFGDALRLSSQRQVLAEWERQRQAVLNGLEELEQARPWLCCVGSAPRC